VYEEANNLISVDRKRFVPNSMVARRKALRMRKFRSYCELETRTGCNAMIRFKVGDDGQWKVIQFVGTHNHEFAKLEGSRRSFSNTCHHLCLWHVSKRGPSYHGVFIVTRSFILCFINVFKVLIGVGVPRNMG